MKYINKRLINRGPPVTIEELNKALQDFEANDTESIEDQDLVLSKFWDSKLETWNIDDDF